MRLEFHDLPERPSNKKDSLGIAENRRVEILSNEWEVTKPIVDKDPKVFPQPEETNWVMKNGIADELVAKRRIEIQRYDKEWNTLTDVGTSQDKSQWDWQSKSGYLPGSMSE